jgi:predicted peroxiredoxin
MSRRSFLSQLAVLPFFGFTAPDSQGVTHKPLKIMMKSAWGSDDPTRASFPFLHGLALAEFGHEVQIFLTGEATYLMRRPTVNAIMPVGWSPLCETLDKIVAKRIPIFS